MKFLFKCRNRVQGRQMCKGKGNSWLLGKDVFRAASQTVVCRKQSLFLIFFKKKTKFKIFVLWEIQNLNLTLPSCPFRCRPPPRGMPPPRGPSSRGRGRSWGWWAWRWRSPRCSRGSTRSRRSSRGSSSRRPEKKTRFLRWFRMMYGGMPKADFKTYSEWKWAASFVSR